MFKYRRHQTIACGVVVIAALSLTACGKQTGDSKSSAAGAVADTSGDTVKVGLLNSLSGTMAISEVTVRDSIKLAVEEINSSGGVLGKKVQPISEDGASDWPTFAEKAEKLMLLLDEPTEGIQPTVVAEIERTILALAGRGGLSVLLVDQHVGFAVTAAQRYHVLQAGRVTSSGQGGRDAEPAVREALTV
jgi:hypothetical protein